MTTQTDDRDGLVPLSGFGDAMKTARTSRGWTQVQLAEYADVNAETINRIERGMNTRTSTMEKIRKVLPDLAASNNGQLTRQQLEAQQEAAAAEERKAAIEALRDQVIHLVRAVPHPDQLLRIRRVIVHQLSTLDVLQSKLPQPKKSRRATR